MKLAFKVKQQPVLSLTFTPPLIDTVRPDFAAIRAAVQAALVPATATPTATPPSPSAASPSAPPEPTAAPTSPPPGTTQDATPVSVDEVCSYS